jgi:hypothetical protein
MHADIYSLAIEFMLSPHGWKSPPSLFHLVVATLNGIWREEEDDPSLSRKRNKERERGGVCWPAINAAWGRRRKPREGKTGRKWERSQNAG